MLEIEEEFDVRLLGVVIADNDPASDTDTAISITLESQTTSTSEHQHEEAVQLKESSAAQRDREEELERSLGETTDAKEDIHPPIKTIDYVEEAPPPISSPSARPKRKVRYVHTRLPNSRRSRISIRPQTSSLTPPSDQPIDTEAAADGTTTDHTDHTDVTDTGENGDTGTDTDTTRISSLHPCLQPIAQMFGIDTAEKVLDQMKEHVSTGYPFPPSLRDFFPLLDDLQTALESVNVLRDQVGLGAISQRMDRKARIKVIRQIAKSRQEIYLSIYSNLILPNAPVQTEEEGGEDGEGEGEGAGGVRGKIELTPGNLEILAKQLPKVFPKDKASIKAFLPDSMGELNGRVVWENGVGRVVGAEGGFRGKIHEGDVHVFVDHSNILYGLLAHLYSSPSESLPPRHCRTLSLPILSYLLRRGRYTPPGTLHLVASSPLRQNLDPAVRLGFEVGILKRVEIPPEEVEDPLAMNLHPKAVEHPPISSSSTPHGPKHKPKAPVTSTFGPNGRRYKEQGVDEILHLKILQTLNANATQPGTIVLATGDARGGQFNRDGFVGAIREAIKRGWNVELWSWSEGLSRGWKEVAKREKWGGARFGIYLLDEWAEVLVEVDNEKR